MPVELEEAVNRLREERVQINSAITKFKEAQDALVTMIKDKVLTQESRFREYKKNISIINYAELDATFKRYQELKEFFSKTDKHESTKESWDEYETLSNRFSLYSIAKGNADVLLVKESCIQEISHVESCSAEMLVCVKRYKALRHEASTALLTLAENSSCLIEERGPANSVLNLYALVDKHIGAMSRFSLAKRTVAMSTIKLTGLSGLTLMGLLKADFIHELQGYFLKKEVNLNIGPFTQDLQNLYQYHTTDITKTQVVANLRDVSKLIQSAAINQMLVINSAAIKENTVDVREIAVQATSRAAKALSTSLNLSEDKVNKIYAFPVNKSGNRMPSLEEIDEIEKDIGSMQVVSRPVSQYIPQTERAPLYTENSAVEEWFQEEEVSFDSEMAKLEIMV